METKKILVTGGKGFIGSNLCLELERKGHEVISLDNNLVGINENLEGFNGKKIDADIRTFDWNSEKFDVLMNQAAITDTTVKDKELMMGVNTYSFKPILNHCLEKGIDIVYASSAAVYGRGKSPMTEDQEKDILSYYAESKNEKDKLSEQYFDKFENKGLNLVGLRYFNVCGPKEQCKGKMSSMIWQMYRMINEGITPKLFKYGEQTRDHVYVKDIIKSNLLSLNPKKNGVYNAGSGRLTSWNKLLEELNKNLGTEVKAEYIDNPYEHYQNETLADLNNSNKYLGYESDYPIEETIKDYVKWLKLKEL